MGEKPAVGCGGTTGWFLGAGLRLRVVVWNPIKISRRVSVFLKLRNAVWCIFCRRLAKTTAKRKGGQKN